MAYEVVQLYIHDVAATYARPVKELKGFERIFLKAGETKTVSIPLDREKLSYYDHKGNLLFEPGEFEIMIGSSSADKDLQKQKINIE